MRRDLRSADVDDRTLDLWDDLPRPPPPPAHPPRGGGVGGRQAGRPARTGGGGYLNGCTASELCADPRLRELAEIGLSATWLGVARQLGYDQFVALWRLLSADPALRNDNNQIELTLRPFRAYERYQRNRYIETLTQQGLPLSLIHQLVRHELGESLGYRQMKRLVAAARVRRA